MQHRYAMHNINVKTTHSLSHCLAFHRGCITEILLCKTLSFLESKGSLDTLIFQPSSDLKPILYSLFKKLCLCR